MHPGLVVALDFPDMWGNKFQYGSHWFEVFFWQPEESRAAHQEHLPVLAYN